ncbi:MAG: transposase [Phycisphaeraceae bacterium]|nr:transposase [Phycisphaeraceae bacterium]
MSSRCSSPLAGGRHRGDGQPVEPQVGAGEELLFLPPYSPDLSPIEPAFSKIKQKLRSLACRTREALWSSMQTVLDTVTTSDATNFFAHCGYRPA